MRIYIVSFRKPNALPTHLYLFSNKKSAQTSIMNHMDVVIGDGTLSEKLESELDQSLKEDDFSRSVEIYNRGENSKASLDSQNYIGDVEYNQRLFVLSVLYRDGAECEMHDDNCEFHIFGSYKDAERKASKIICRNLSHDDTLFDVKEFDIVYLTTSHINNNHNDVLDHYNSLDCYNISFHIDEVLVRNAIEPTYLP